MKTKKSVQDEIGLKNLRMSELEGVLAKNGTLTDAEKNEWRQIVDTDIPNLNLELEVFKVNEPRYVRERRKGY